ncbi:hypothetical protein EK21DRAFT_84553 [Setomelanomma holmii]|uniref:Clr5 domain-containing protein n=1 Tax=Setomelanomma holmii TaxID=210430 RepID=A0A9P4HM50_9PLEO|nr:hypothetical protein EK21DRAFT_84553 [Setomelanomma holmii]
MPKRKVDEEAEWGRHKSTIVHLYVREDRPLTEVIQTMAEQGFKRTKPQYERTFKSWGITKNVREAEWTFIFGRLEERERLKKPSVVIVCGMSISDARLRKQRASLRETTFDRRLAQSRSSPRPTTPQGIAIRTPPLSPALENSAYNGMNIPIFREGAMTDIEELPDLAFDSSPSSQSCRVNGINGIHTRALTASEPDYVISKKSSGKDITTVANNHTPVVRQSGALAEASGQPTTNSVTLLNWLGGISPLVSRM